MTPRDADDPDPPPPLLEGGVLVLRLGATLDRAARRDLLDRLDEAFLDPALEAVILAASGRGWPASPDPVEADAEPALGALALRIAQSPVPVIAALQGPVLGGALSLAIAAQWRVAQDGATLGFPEATVGLCPAAGATQRLPQLVGARAALSILLSGLPLVAAQAHRIGLVDAVVPNEAEAAARALAIAHTELGLAPWANRAPFPEDAGAYLDAVAEARANLGRNSRLPAPGRIVDCVEAAVLLPDQEGYVFERCAALELAATPEARALGHVARAERALAAAPLPARPRAVTRIAVVGNGEAGAAIAAACLGAGLPVVLAERDTAGLELGLARIDAVQDRAVAAGRLDDAARAAAWARLSGTTDLAAVAAHDLVLSALSGDEDEELLLFADLGQTMRPGAVLACGAEGVEISGLAAAAGRPADVIGLRCDPAARLAEVAAHEGAAPEAVATGLALLRRLGRVALTSGPLPGSILGHLRRALYAAVAALMEAGATPYAIDRALLRAGFAHGPFEDLDRHGLDGAAAHDWLGTAAGARGSRIGLLTGALLAQGRTGSAAGGGFYLYDGGHRREDPALGSLWGDPGRSAGPGSAQILRLVLAALANEGARLVSRGMAAAPSAIDLAAVHGLGLPRAIGGPMQAADEAGALAWRTLLREQAAAEAARPGGRPGFWTPGPLWDDLVKNGSRFADLG